jgi:hypothetical protein
MVPTSNKLDTENRLLLFMPISLIRWSTLYAGKMAKYKAFILITNY